ncbi:MAG TPA: pyrroline-5-carboxylate reductase [Quisquiliibacterium sp.]|nr:pyrroline-5-carboxylate reductase [Quisquiliibacterium sp.]
MHITFIGGGNMAQALIGGLVADGTDPGTLRVVEPVAAQRELLRERYDVASGTRSEDLVPGSDVVVLAVKPQQMREVCAGLAPALSGQLVISIAAGIRATDLSRWLRGHTRIVRCMPNTPALIGAGLTGLCAMPGLAGADRETADTLLASVGQTLWVEDEAMLDAITAVSGSGPAYVFYFMEAMHTAALGMGFDDEQARALTLATFTGAARLAADSPEPASVLRERVTSKGGTTAAALAVMAARGVDRHIVEALAAARSRSAELGDELGRG